MDHWFGTPLYDPVRTRCACDRRPLATAAHQAAHQWPRDGGATEPSLKLREASVARVLQLLQSCRGLTLGACCTGTTSVPEVQIVCGLGHSNLKVHTGSASNVRMVASTHITLIHAWLAKKQHGQARTRAVDNKSRTLTCRQPRLESPGPIRDIWHPCV